MAIYHMQAKVVSRGSGRSAVAASAYMSCSRMYNDYDGIQHDYTRKQGLIYQEVMLPPMAPSKWNDREQLWNAVEENEKTKDSRLAREFVVALPVELDKDSNISLLQDFIKKNFVNMGMCADFAIHDTDGHNPHAHILLTVRPLNENGTWQYKTEKEYLCIKNGEEKGFTATEFKAAQKDGWEKQYRYKVGKKKVYMTASVAQEKGYDRIDKHPKSSRYGRQNPISEQWNSDEQLCIWRANWADTVNEMLARNQINASIDHRSFADQGITEQPTIHEGYIAQNMEKKDMQPLFDCIVNNIPAPEGDPDADTQMLISTIDYNEFVGRIGVGKIDNGSLKVNQEVMIVNHHDPSVKKRVRITKLYTFNGLNKVEVNEAGIGEIVAVSGIADIHIGDTICSLNNPVAIPFQKISEPTLSMDFMVNDSPLAGKEGKFVTSRHLRDRLFKELNTDVSLRVEETPGVENSFKVSGRGELHLSVLIENMRREGYEFAVSKAEVLYHTDERGKKLEPMELAYIDVPDDCTGSVIQKLSQRKGELLGMSPINGGYTRLQFSIPSRGLIGYRGEFLTDTKGNGIINSSFEGYEEYKGDISYRKNGSLIAYESGDAITYGLFNAQERGTLFIGPGEKVYAGMIVGENPRTEDIEVNVCKTKHLTNTRSSSADEALRLVPPKILSLEQALDYIDTDELLEVTPKSLRIRKKILDHTARYRANKK